jgi:hypothetical protein
MTAAGVESGRAAEGLERGRALTAVAGTAATAGSEPARTGTTHGVSEHVPAATKQV